MRGLRSARLRWLDTINLLAIVVTLLSGFFILTGTWVVVCVLPVLAALGLDGVLRSHPVGRIRTLHTAATQVLAPVGLAVAASLFFRWVATGYWGVAGALVTGAVFAIAAYAAYLSLDVQASPASFARTMLVVTAYAGFFALVAVYYTFDLSQPAAAALTGIAAALFSVEVFREADFSPADLITYSLATGFVLAQVRWAAGYIRLDGLLAALLLLLVFYVATGLLLAAARRRLDRRIGTEFGAVGLAGLAIVVAGRLIAGS